MDIEITLLPFERLAQKLNKAEDEYILSIMQSMDRNEIKRFGAIIDHNKAGYEYNILLAWHIPGDKIDEVGQIIAEFTCISHCYQRRPAPNWPYNLYGMLHAKNEKDAISHMNSICKSVDQVTQNKFTNLKTIKELKKMSFRPF